MVNGKIFYHHYIFIISQLWLTSHPRSTVVLLVTGNPGTSREIYSEDADGETRMRSQPQWRNDKYTVYNHAIHQLDKLNSFTAIAFELVSSMARALGL